MIPTKLINILWRRGGRTAPSSSAGATGKPLGQIFERKAEPPMRGAIKRWGDVKITAAGDVHLSGWSVDLSECQDQVAFDLTGKTLHVAGWDTGIPLPTKPEPPAIMPRDELLAAMEIPPGGEITQQINAKSYCVGWRDGWDERNAMHLEMNQAGWPGLAVGKSDWELFLQEWKRREPESTPPQPPKPDTKAAVCWDWYCLGLRDGGLVK